jgi:hypothetical protein
LRSSATAADEAASTGSKTSARIHADLHDLSGYLHHDRAAIVAAVVVLVVVWVGARRLRRYLGRRWIGNHLELIVKAFPATDLNFPPARRSRISGAKQLADVRVVRVELASRTTTATCVELVR